MTVSTLLLQKIRFTIATFHIVYLFILPDNSFIYREKNTSALFLITVLSISDEKLSASMINVIIDEVLILVLVMKMIPHP